MMLANASEVHLTQTTKTKLSSNYNSNAPTTDAEKKNYNASERAFQLLVRTCTGLVPGFVDNTRTKDQMDGDVL